VLVAATGAAGAGAATVAAVTSSADRMRQLADRCAVDADMEGVDGGGASAAIASRQLPPVSTLAVMATVGDRVQSSAH